MGIKFTSKVKRDALAKRLADLSFRMCRALDQGGDHMIQVDIETLEDLDVAIAVVGMAEINGEVEQLRAEIERHAKVCCGEVRQA